MDGFNALYTQSFLKFCGVTKHRITAIVNSYQFKRAQLRLCLGARVYLNCLLLRNKFIYSFIQKKKNTLYLSFYELPTLRKAL